MKATGQYEQDFTIWGAALSPSPCLRPVWSDWITSFQSLTSLSEYTSWDALEKFGVSFCLDSVTFAATVSAFFSYRQLFLLSWAYERASREPHRFLVFVILWYLGMILGLLPLCCLWAVPYFSSLTQSYLKSSNWNTKMKYPRLHIFIPINHWICVPVFTPLVF